MEKTTTTVAQKKVIVLSLGGSIMAPGEGPDARFVRRFRALIVRYVRRGFRFVIVVGGGAPCRQYQAALRASGTTNATLLDWIGISVSRLNAEFLRLSFGGIAENRILFAGGEKPGQSTDHVAVTLALRFGATTVYNLSNIRAVYDRDPKKYVNAKPQKSLSWIAMKKIVGTRWTPGANIPFDPRATRLAARHRLRVVFLDGRNLRNVDRALSQQAFRGSVVS